MNNSNNDNINGNIPIRYGLPKGLPSNPRTKNSPRVTTSSARTTNGPRTTTSNSSRTTSNPGRTSSGSVPKKVMPKQVPTKVGKVQVNEQAFSNGKKFKITRNKVIAGVLVASAIFFAGFQMGKSNGYDKGRASVAFPEDCIMEEVRVDVNSGDTLSEIASIYYNSNYESYYGDLYGYIDQIAEINRVKPNKLSSDDVLTIPVIFDKSNPYYAQILDLKRQEKEIMENEYWVEYTVPAHTYITMSHLAALSAAPGEEIVTATNEIVKRNKGRSNYHDRERVFEIINPKLGTIRTALYEAQKNFEMSLKNSSYRSENMSTYGK